MSESDRDVEPDWSTPLRFTLTPEELMHTVFASADSVHTGWESCVESKLVVAETTALHDQSEGYCRFVEQEYVTEEEPEVTWHDWTVELKVEDTYVTAHWRSDERASPAEWDWCAAEAENAFTAACVLVGKRVRRGIVVADIPGATPRTPRTRH